jgi:hypothetical protein
VVVVAVVAAWVERVMVRGTLMTYEVEEVLMGMEPQQGRFSWQSWFPILRKGTPGPHIIASTSVQNTYPPGRPHRYEGDCIEGQGGEIQGPVMALQNYRKAIARQ